MHNHFVFLHFLGIKIIVQMLMVKQLPIFHSCAIPIHFNEDTLMCGCILYY